MRLCAARGMVLPDYGQTYVIMQNRVALGGAVAGIVAGDMYWTSSTSMGGWPYPVGLDSTYVESNNAFDWNPRRIRCVR